MQQNAQNEAIHLQVRTQSEIELAKVKADLDAKLSVLDAYLKAATARETTELHHADDLAVDKGLGPKGDPLHPDYPRRWNDPVTNEPRLRLDRGHVDSKTGQPFDIQNAAVDHVHGYDINGNPIEVNGDNHIPTKGE